MVSSLVAEITQVVTMITILFNMCNSNDFNRKQCIQNWDTWLLPEISRAWQIKIGEETPYQNEQNMLESYGTEEY